MEHHRTLFNRTATIVDFDMKEPSLKEIQELVKAAPASSAIQPNSVPYEAYKWYPDLLTLLWKLL